MKEEIPVKLAKYGTVGICIALILFMCYLVRVNAEQQKRYDNTITTFANTYKEIIEENTKASEGLKNSIEQLNATLGYINGNNVTYITRDPEISMK